MNEEPTARRYWFPWRLTTVLLLFAAGCRNATCGPRAYAQEGAVRKLRAARRYQMAPKTALWDDVPAPVIPSWDP